MSRPKVFTYYEVIPETGSQFDEIDVCARSWLMNGWDFEVLTERMAVRSELYSALDGKINSFPTLNDRMYERACFMRWCALDAVGGGLLIDYDMINYSFKPEDLDFRESVILSADKKTPPIYAKGEDARILIKLFLDYNPPETDKHVSDMTIFRYDSFPFKWLPVMLLFGEGAWHSAPLVHYSHNCIRDRALLMKYIR